MTRQTVLSDIAFIRRDNRALKERKQNNNTINAAYTPTLSVASDNATFMSPPYALFEITC